MHLSENKQKNKPNGIYKQGMAISVIKVGCIYKAHHG